MDRRRAVNLGLSLLVCIGFLYLAFRNVSLAELGAALARVDLGWIAVAVGISFAIMIFRAWRWQLELRPLERVPFGRLWVVTAVAYMAINLFPARLGEVVRPWLLSRRSSVSFSNVVGNLVLEKTLDSLVIVFYILVGLIAVENLPEWVRSGAMVPAAVAAVLVTLVILLYWRGEVFFDRHVIRHLPARFGEGVKRVVASIVGGMSILPDTRLLLGVFAVSLALWFLPILSSWVTIQAFGLDAPFSAAVVVFIFIGFGTALPNVPGMFGPYQYACILALGMFGVAQADALAYGLVLNAIQFLTLIAQGLVALPLADVRFTDLMRADRYGPAPPANQGSGTASPTG
jgi:glycosyltransferase 2 family protein